jgi:hypothetical protein
VGAETAAVDDVAVQDKPVAADIAQEFAQQVGRIILPAQMRV